MAEPGTATLAKMNVAARDRVERLERRYGSARVKLVGGALLLLLLILGLRNFAGGKRAPGAPPPRPVVTARVTQKDVPLYVDEIGTCSAVATVQIQAQVSGQIISRDFKDGADVKKGDVLFKIDERPYRAALDQAKGQLGQVRAQLALDQLTLQRQQNLRGRNVNTQADLDLAQGTVNSDDAKAKSAEAAVAAAQVNLDYCTIRSPIDGRVGLRNVDAGNVVGPTSTALVTVQSLDPIYTDFTVAEPDLPLVRRYLGGANVKVLTDAENDDIGPRSGDLYFIDTAVQPGAGTVKARGVTPNPDHALWPSQFVRVRLVLDILKGAKLVPSSAVQIGQNGPFIFVVKSDSTLDLRLVKPGQKQGDFTVINSGVQNGEMVVVSGQLQLSPGLQVEAKEMETGSLSHEKAGAKTFH